MTAAQRNLRLAVLASGGGRTLENLVERSRDGSLLGEVVLVISNRADAFVLTRARKHGLDARCIDPKSLEDRDAFARELYPLLEQERIDLVLLAGYLHRLPLHDNWIGRVMNIHPALLPSFGGPGCYGRHVHEAVRQAGVRLTGCTVHFIDEQYDRGPIILQRAVPVSFEDSAEEIAHRVFEEEKLAYPEAINLFARDRLRIEDGRVRILP